MFLLVGPQFDFCAIMIQVEWIDEFDGEQSEMPTFVNPWEMECVDFPVQLLKQYNKK